jgi:rod shape determining protein RodA
MWVFQLFINVGMTMGIMPITGLTLPFVSFGGSSMVVNFLSVGLLLNIHMRRYL